MEPSNVQEVEQIEETKSYVPVYTEIERKWKSYSALRRIVQSLWKLGAFLSDILLDSKYIYEEDPRGSFLDYLIGELNSADFLEGNVSRDLFAKIMEHIPRWNSHFEVHSLAKKSCSRCKMNLEYPFERSYGMNIVADSLRELKAAFKDFTFETILKVIKIHSKMLCNKEGCGKRNCVESVILKLPSVFTIALEWENNESPEKIFDTASVLATEIDITAIYKYEGDSTFTKYRLVSMVCFWGERYYCVAYERNIWVRYLSMKKHMKGTDGSDENEVIGDWDDILNMFRDLNIRPEILFYENAMQRDRSGI